MPYSDCFSYLFFSLTPLYHICMRNCRIISSQKRDFFKFCTVTIYFVWIDLFWPKITINYPLILFLLFSDGYRLFARWGSMLLLIPTMGSNDRTKAWNMNSWKRKRLNLCLTCSPFSGMNFFRTSTKGKCTNNN